MPIQTLTRTRIDWKKINWKKMPRRVQPA